MLVHCIHDMDTSDEPRVDFVELSSLLFTSITVAPLFHAYPPAAAQWEFQIISPSWCVLQQRCHTVHAILPSPVLGKRLKRGRRMIPQGAGTLRDFSREQDMHPSLRHVKKIGSRSTIAVQCIPSARIVVHTSHAPERRKGL